MMNPSPLFVNLVNSIFGLVKRKKMFIYTLIASLSTFVELLDLPVFWPILLIYFIFATLATFLKQKKHMEKYGYSI